MDSDDIKYMAKKVLRLIFAGKKAKIILIIVLILLLILFMLLPASFYFITIDDGIWDDDEKGKPSNYTDNAKISTDATKMGIVVDKDTMVKNGLKDLGYDDEKIANMTDEDIIEVFKINKKLKKDPPITSLDELTQAELLWCLNDAYSSYLKKPAELEKLLNAELITQYPDLGPNVTELNGIIKFERHKADGSSEFLTYIDSNTFTGYVDSNNTDALKYFTLDEQGNALVAYSDKTTETVTSNDGDMKLSDYTDGLDDSNKQSNGNYSKTTITVSSVSINYKSAVEKYTMPFNYLWSLLVIGEDKDFVLELADLVENSEITISIYDNIVTTEDVNTYTYKKETRTDKYARLSVRNASGVSGYPTERYWSAEDSPSGNYDPRYQASYNTDSTEYKVTNTVINERNQIKYDLTKADVWIVDYSKGYDFPKDVTSSVDSNSADLDDTAYTLNTETSVKGDAAVNDSDILAFKQTVENFVKKKVGNSSTSRSGTGSGSKTSVTEKKSSGSGNKSSGSGKAPIGGSTSGANSNSNSEEVKVVVVDAELKNYDHFVERKHTQTVTTTDKTYVAQTPVNNPKDDKNADTDNFVKILCKESHVEAKSYLTDGKTTSWLWEIMEKNCPDYIDLTKYLFYKVTGRSFGVDSFDFSAFDPGSFQTVSGSGTASEMLLNFINTFEGGKTNSDGTKYIVEDDGAGNLVVGHGIDIYNSGYLQEFLDAGYSVTKGSEIDKEFVDNLELMEIEKHRKNLLSRTAGINLTEYQIAALISRAYNCGDAGATGTRNGKNFVQAYTAYWNQDRDDKYSKKDSNADFNHKLYTEYMSKPVTSGGKYLKGLETRRKAEWTLFQTGYDTVSGQWYSAGGGAVIEAAKEIHAYMEQNGYTYCVYGGNGYEECKGGGHGLNTTFEQSKNGYHHTCCATYVSWVLQKAGYLSESEHSNSASGLQSIMKKKGFKVINNQADLQPGDVLCYSSHVEIYAGDNKVYNAGSGRAIRSASPANVYRSFNYALRPVK